MIKKFLFRSFLLTLIGFLAISCSSEIENEEIIPNQPAEEEQPEPISESRKPISLSQTEQDITKQLNDFNVRFTADACRYIDGNKDAETTNIVCSPLGTEIILSMMANGVSDSAKEDILQYLGVSDLETLNALNKILIDALPVADKSSYFSIANALWANTSLVKGLNDDFSSVFSNIYSGNVNLSDFVSENAKTLQNINEWGAKSTNGLISKYLEELKTSLYGIILNSIYFKGFWRDKPFNPESTSKGIFHGFTSENEVDFMNAKKFITLYNFDNDFQYIMLPYGNQAYAMHILIPKGDFSYDTNNLITWERLKSFMEESGYTDLELSMPKFKFNSSLDISELFRSTGRLNMLGGPVGLSMFDKPIDGALTFSQGLSFSVDEKGAEVAAISSANTEFTSDFEEEPQIIRVNIDKPFYFFIQEYSTGAILLSGRITDL